MPKHIRTMGSPAEDREIDRIWAELQKLQAAIAALTPKATATDSTLTPNIQPVPSDGTISVSEVDGDPILQVNGIAFDQADGFVVTVGDNDFAKINISGAGLTTNAPADVGSSAVVGTDTHAAHGDHVHKGLHSLSKSGSSALYGDVTLTGTGGVVLNQVGQNIAVDGSAITGSSTANFTYEDQSGGQANALYGYATWIVEQFNTSLALAFSTTCNVIGVINNLSSGSLTVTPGSLNAFASGVSSYSIGNGAIALFLATANGAHYTVWRFI